MPLFTMDDFSGGLNTQLDATKIPDNCYPLLINGRVRKNVVGVTKKHVQLTAPEGNYQGLYAVGSVLILIVSGKAYRADITVSPIIFYPVAGWTDLDATVARITAELVPAMSNRFNRTGTPDSSTRVFNNSMAVFPEALFCFDGINQGNAILPSANAQVLGTYTSWIVDDPNYVPVGKQPAFCSNKLFLASPDGKKIFHSVSGRAHDFVVNLDVNGDKGGDADTVSTSVSFNPITCMRSLSSGQVLVATLYSTHTLVLDYTDKIFGEPYLQPNTLFPVGIVNEISIVDVLQDTAFITQSGINSFNAVSQALRESNNYTFGARIRGLITDPISDSALVQADTCATLYNDYALFAINTIHGYGVVVYDTYGTIFHALDLSFGHVKQFINTRLSGQERLFYITHDNKLFEAFASEELNTNRIYMGEWTPDSADQDALVNMVDIQFSSARTSGQCKISVYADHKLRESAVVQCTAPGYSVHTPIPIPYAESQQNVSVGFQLGDKIEAWKIGVLIEWNFDATLNAISIDGEIQKADNVDLGIAEQVTGEKFAFIADSGYPSELNNGTAFPAAGFLVVSVTKGTRYIYFSNGNGALANGSIVLNQGIFTAASNEVTIQGYGAATYSLRPAESYLSVLDAVSKEKVPAIFHGGDFAYEYGTVLDVQMAKYPLRLPVEFTPGNHDVFYTANGQAFFNLMQTPRYHFTTYKYISVFYYNATSYEPDGYTVNSIQAGHLRNWIADHQNYYRFVVCHFPPYTNDVNHSPGRTDLRFLLSEDIHAMFCGHAHEMERFDINGKPLYVCGTGGTNLRSFTPVTVTPYAFRDNTHYGYILLTADALSCRVDFKDTDGNILDSSNVYR
jgi:Icc-related predicted phosphoesterase